MSWYKMGLTDLQGMLLTFALMLPTVGVLSLAFCVTDRYRLTGPLAVGAFASIVLAGLVLIGLGASGLVALFESHNRKHPWRWFRTNPDGSSTELDPEAFEPLGSGEPTPPL